MAIALDRPSLITPGLKPVDPSFESWWVRPGGATVVHVRPGDRMTVRDPDGGQPAEVTVLDGEGGEDAAALGARADAPATVLRAALRHGARAPFLGELHRRGLRPDAARAVALFGRDSAPGASQSFIAERAATVVVAGPGGRGVEGARPGAAPGAGAAGACGAPGRARRWRTRPAPPTRASRWRSSCRPRWPSRASTSAS